jgi:hypothetical protein
LHRRRGWNCNGRAARPGLNGGRYRLLGATACNGNACSRDHPNCDCACTGTHQEVTSRGEWTDVLATVRLDFGRLRI